jgi:hypothetical protein
MAERGRGGDLRGPVFLWNHSPRDSLGGSPSRKRHPMFGLFLTSTSGMGKHRLSP